MNDPRFFAPMVNTQLGQLYVGDFILFSGENGQQLARVQQFFCQVQGHHVHYNTMKYT